MQRQPPLDRQPSPRAAFEARHGSAVPVVYADGRTRAATAADFPDERTLRVWQASAHPLWETPLDVLPDWGPWHEWLDLQGRARRPRGLRAWRR